MNAQEKEPSQDGYLATADSIVLLLYDLVTIKTGSQPDWNTVRSLFIEEAVIVLRTSRDHTSIFSVDGFVEDFQKFIKRANIKKTGFEEKIISKKTMVFGDMAQSLVLYEAHIPGSERPPQKGIDNFLLIKKDDRWWIVAITNEIPTPNNPIPPELLQ